MTLDSFIEKVADNIVNPTIIAMFAIAMVVFLWGVASFVKKSDDAAARKEGASHIMWGLIGMFVMVSAFTILRIVLGSFSSYGVQIPDTIR